MNNKQQDPLCVNLPISGNISTNSHDGSDLKNIATCSAASSKKEKHLFTNVALDVDKRTKTNVF